MGVSPLPSKLQRPRLGPQTVPRAQLLERLDAALDADLTLLSAPAGFGKTTLVAEWLARRAPPAYPCAVASSPAAAHPPPDLPPDGSDTRFVAAWLTLDTTDNDPIRFWTCVAGALHALRPQGAAFALDAAVIELVSARLPLLDAAVELLLHALEHVEVDLVLVLDDYQSIRTPQVHETLHFFIGHLPPRVHLVLLTRADPPLPLHRWRLHGRLVELRARDLCFSTEEAGAMLSRRTKVVLSQETIELLVDHTDGWPAGLQLLALSLQGRSTPEIDRFVAEFAGSNRYVLNYLLEEVLQSQPPPVRNFLLRTSILPRFCAPLCERLMAVDRPEGPADSASSLSSSAILEELEGSNLFLVPLDDERVWYRYYHLFAEALHAKLDQDSPELDSALHRTAAHWYAAHGFTDEAIDHAVLAEDWEQAGDLVSESARTLILRGDFASLYRWTDAMPVEVITARPRLAVTRGWLLLFRGPLLQVQSLVDRLAASVGEVGIGDDGSRFPTPGEPVALRAMLAAFRWQVRQTLALCAEAERLLSPDDFFSRAAVHQAAGIAYLMAARYEDAADRFQRAISLSQQLGSISMALFARFRLAQTYLRQGHVRVATQIYRRHLQEAHDRGGARWPVLADGLIGMADLLREQNDLLAAEHYVRRGLTIAPSRTVEVWAWGRAVQARISLALGRHDQSLHELDEAIRQAIQYTNEHLAETLRAHRARLDLMLGELEAARQWAQSYSGTWNEGGYLPIFEELTLARFYLADRRPRAALALLDTWRVHAEAAGRTRGLIEIDLLRALALGALGQRSEAQGALQRALALAEPENLQRVFLDEGARMQPLLEAVAPTSEFAGLLLASIRDGSASGRPASPLTAPLDKLTPREMEILRALARGASNQEVAATFVLTVGTVKGHVNHILSKLGARNRTEAVALGRELGLL